VEERGLTTPSGLGRVAITAEALARIVARTVTECYGTIGMRARPTGVKVASVLVHIQEVERSA
jgi:uncharacterized alkaline shock family protein YloU